VLLPCRSLRHAGQACADKLKKEIKQFGNPPVFPAEPEAEAEAKDEEEPEAAKDAKDAKDAKPGEEKVPWRRWRRARRSAVGGTV
jgi:hypothetical protein